MRIKTYITPYRPNFIIKGLWIYRFKKDFVLNLLRENFPVALDRHIKNSKLADEDKRDGRIEFILNSKQIYIAIEEEENVKLFIFDGGYRNNSKYLDLFNGEGFNHYYLYCLEGF